MKISMLAAVSVTKVITFLLWQKRWKSIIEYVTRIDLQQRQLKNLKKKRIISKYTNYCRNITFLYWTLTYATGLAVIAQPIFKYFLSSTYRANIRNGSEPYLEIASSWVPFEKNSGSGYVGASVIQAIATIYASGWITSYDTNAIAIMVFFKGAIEFLREDSRNIFKDDNENNARRRLVDCHTRHKELIKYFRMFNSCLSLVLLVYVIVCSVMLCVTAYQINIERNVMQKFLIAEFLVFGITQLFIYCWHSNDIYYASESLMRGPYESSWWMKNVTWRKDVFMLTAQFDRTAVFSAGPFAKLTVATFISILKGAYSYYTLIGKSQTK